jgi:hypothetical protein
MQLTQHSFPPPNTRQWVFPRKQHVAVGSLCLCLHVTNVKWKLQSPVRRIHHCIACKRTTGRHEFCFFLRKTTDSSLLVNKTNRRTEFQFYWYYDSTCFGQSFCPSSGVLSRTSALVQFMHFGDRVLPGAGCCILRLSAHHQEFLAVHRHW